MSSKQSEEIGKTLKDVTSTLGKVEYKIEQVNKLLHLKEWVKTSMVNLESRCDLKISENMMQIRNTMLDRLDKDIEHNKTEVIFPKIDTINEDLSKTFVVKLWFSKLKN